MVLVRQSAKVDSFSDRAVIEFGGLSEVVVNSLKGLVDGIEDDPPTFTMAMWRIDSWRQC